MVARHRGTARCAALAGVVAAVGLGLVAAPAAAATGAIVVTTTVDVVDLDDGVTSLREAFDQANANAAADVIVLAFFATYELTLGDPFRPDDDTNAGGDLDHVLGAGALVIQGEVSSIDPDHSRAIHQLDPALLAVHGVRIWGGEADVDGGAIRAAGDVDLDRVGLRDSISVRSDGSGGGLFAGGTATIRDSEISGNTAHSGGGVYAGELLLEDSTISDNATEGRFGLGGGLNIEGAVTIRDSIIWGNTSSGGGGIVAGGMVVVEDSLLVYNRAQRSAHAQAPGGAIRSAGGVELVRTQVRANHADGSGGGIGAGGLVRLTESRVTDNSAGDRYGVDGAGIFADDVVAVRSTVADNRLSVSHGGATESGTGAGIHAENSVRLVRSTVSGNVAQSAANSAGVFARNAITVQNSTVSGNVVTGDGAGGGLRTGRSGTILLSHATVVRNIAAIGSNIDAGGAFTSSRSVVALPRGAGANCRMRGVVHSGGYNVVGGGSCGLGVGPGDRRGVGDPGLDPLAYNDGPTYTHLPRPGGPLSAIPPAACAAGVDQRGEARPAGARCEVGAVEIG